MNKKTLKDVDLKNKKVILRVAYDISLKEKDGKWIVPNDTRIRATLPTIKYLLDQNCRLILLSWLKRPGGKVVEKYRMDPVAEKLSEILGQKVLKLNDCVGEEVEKAVEKMKPREIIMLENVRFHPEEENNDPQFAQKLASLGEIVVFDAFAQSHRIHASTVGILKYLPSVAGFLLEKEIDILSKILKSPKKPLVVVLGGAKISDKVGALKNLMKIADIILIGGALANIFFKAQGIRVAKSLIEDVFVDKAKKEKVDSLAVANQLLLEAKDQKVNLEYPKPLDFIQLPLDLVAADKIEEEAQTKIIDFSKKEEIPSDWLFLDIGPKTIELFKNIIEKAKTIFWNGPMGYFELEKFALGTREIAQAITSSKALSVIGGGDTEKVVKMFNLEGQFDFVSTGGGASLEFLSGQPLPAVEALPDK